MKKISYKALASSAMLSASTLFASLTAMPTFAVEGQVKLEVEVGSAISMTIQSSSDGDTVYGVINSNEIKKIDTFDMDKVTPFGVSSAKTSMLPNEVNEKMSSTVKVFTNNTAGFSLSVRDADEDTSLKNEKNDTILAGTKIEQGSSNWGLKGGLITNYAAVPKSTETGLKLKGTTTKTTGGDTTTVTYGVSTSADQATGTYSDVIVYTATANE